MEAVPKRFSRRRVLTGTLILIGIGILCVVIATRSTHRRNARPEQSKTEVSPIPPSTFASLPLAPSSNQIADRVHLLGNDLPEEEQQALINWMLNRPLPGLAPSSWHWVVNEVMDVLCRQNVRSSRLTAALAGLANSQGNDIVLRDYAIQHLATLLEEAGANRIAVLTQQEEKCSLQALIGAAGKVEGSTAGTALQGLHRGLASYSAASREMLGGIDLADLIQQLRTLAFQLIRSERANPLACITALHVCAQREFDEVLTEARSMALDRELSTSVRLSAIGVLGLRGGKEDRQLLADVVKEASPRLSVAVKGAALRINKRELINTNVIRK